MRLHRAASGFFILQIAWAAAVMGIPTLGPVHQVTTGDPSCQQEPMPAPLRSGGFAVAWNHGDIPAVLLRAADAEGNLVAPEVSFPGRRVHVMGSDAAGDLTLVWRVTPNLGFRLQRLSAGGQPLGPEVDLPISSGSPLQVGGAVAPDGSVAVVWQSGRRIAARWFSAQGVALGPEIEIDLLPSDRFYLPFAATIDTAGRLVVAWPVSTGAPPTEAAVVFRRFEAGGSAMGPAVPVSRDLLPPGFEWNPAIASLRDGGIAVAWQRDRLTTTPYDILLRRFDASNEPVGELVYADAEFGYGPRLASDGDDRLALVWTEGNYGTGRMQLQSGKEAPEPAVPLHPELLQGLNPESATALFLNTGRIAALWQTWYESGVLPTGCEDLGIFERIVDPTPAVQPPQPAGPDVLLAGPSQTGFAPQIALAPDGSWVALWQRGANGPVVSRAFDAAGQARGPETPITGASPKTARYDLALAPLPGGGFVAAWLDLSSSEPAAIRRLGADGQPAGAAVPVQLSAGARKIRVAAGGDGFLLAWFQGSSGIIHAQRFHTAGTPIGTPFFLTGTGGSVQDFDLEAHPGGGFVMAWAGSATEIFARRLDAAGQPAGPDLLASTGNLLQAAPRIAPDADGGFAVAWAAVVPSFRFASAVFLRRFGPDGRPREEVIEVQALQDLSYEIEDSPRVLFAADLSSSRDGMLWVLLERSNDFKKGLYGLAVVDGVPVGPPVDIAEGVDIGDADIAADGCGWIVGWNVVQGALSQNHARRFTGGCPPDALHLGGLGGRFRAEIVWRTRDGKSGAGQALPLTDDTGAFWFFAPDNLELMLKILDGRDVNGAFWVFYATLTDVAFDLRVTDTFTGERKVYSKPAGRLESRADVGAFPLGPAPAAAPPPAARWLADAVAAAPAAADAGPPCGTSETALCLGGRFRVGVRLVDPRDGVERQAIARPLTADSGAFWFFGPENLELMLKVVDGRPLNDHFWFFSAGLSDVEYEITVTDTQTGLVRVYENPRGTLASRADTAAFGE